MTAVVHVGLGSNLGDTEEFLCQAASEVLSLDVAGVSASSVWCSEPVGFDKPVPDFLNAVLRFETQTTPMALLEALKKIETTLGRKRKGGRGYLSRTIDLDIIDFGGRLLDEPGLSLPHPRAALRLFVLLPLQQVSPGFLFPENDKSLAELIAAAPAIEIREATRFRPLV